jgi:hypothetical protein
MTLTEAGAEVLDLAKAAAERGGHDDDVATLALRNAVEAKFFPSEAGKLAAAAELLAKVARSIASSEPPPPGSADRQRAADRLTAYLDEYEEHASGSEVLDPGTMQMLPDLDPIRLPDLRLLTEAAPPLDPKWSAPLASAAGCVVIVVSDQDTGVLYASSSEDKVADFRLDHGRKTDVTHIVVDG